MREQGQASWHWQQEGTSWRGVGIYHVTLAVPSREPLLGRLDIPDGDPAKAREAGSDYIVVGRPITAAPDPVAAWERCVNEFVKGEA